MLPLKILIFHFLNSFLLLNLLLLFVIHSFDPNDLFEDLKLFHSYQKHLFQVLLNDSEEFLFLFEFYSVQVEVVVKYFELLINYLGLHEDIFAIKI